MRGTRRLLLGALVAAALAAVALAGPASAAPGGVPGQPDQSGTGEPPVSGVVRPLSGGDLNKSRSQPPSSSRTNDLKYGGGLIQVTPRVYLVFWGSQWQSNDPVASRLQSFLGAVGTSETWSRSTTQYCEHTVVGATTCTSGATPVGQPATALAPAGVWFDNASVAPRGASQSVLAAEARNAVSHFSQSAPMDSNIQIVIATPSGASPQGFGSSYCAWHSYTNTALGSISYTNLPYMPDAGAACGANFVNSGPAGALDGVSIVEGHEYAESATDPFLNAWKDQQGAENGDKCAWINSGQGAAVNLSGTPYAVQSLWSNAFNSGLGGCVSSSP